MRTGFIGTGNMGGSILRAYASSARAAEDTIMICDRSDERADAFLKDFPGMRRAETIADLVRESDLVVFGVKPQGMEEVLKEACAAWDPEMTAVSMAAGVSIAYLEGFFPEGTPVVRIMPNTPAMVGEGMVAVCPGSFADEAAVERAEAVLRPSGRLEIVPEDMIDCVIGVSGSSPAYTFMYIQALAQAACDNGMPPEQARVFAAQAVLGAAKLVLESPESLDQLRINVCSPGGTTIEAVNKLMENGFMDSVKEGFQAAVDKSVEMTKAKGSGK